MKVIIVFVAFFAVILAHPGAEVEVSRHFSDIRPDGFKFGVETNDGSAHDAEGKLKDAETDHAALVVQGSYKFVANDGHTYSVKYIADENGFHPQGDHLPVA